MKQCLPREKGGGGIASMPYTRLSESAPTNDPTMKNKQTNKKETTTKKPNTKTNVKLK